MTRLAERQASALREQAEHHLRVAAMEDLRRAPPAGHDRAVPRARRRASGGSSSCPLYRRVPWEAKQRAMHALRMTAESHGWTPPAREPGEPWRPPAPPPT